MGRAWGVQLRAGAVIGIGLLLALATDPLPPASGEPGASLTVRLPDAVRTAVLALLALSAILLLALQRPRRPTEDEPLDARAAYQPRPARAMLLSLLPLLLLLAAARYLVWNAAADDAHPIERALTALAGLLDLLASARKTPTSVPIFDFTIASLVLLAELKEARAFPVQKVTRRP